MNTYGIDPRYSSLGNDDLIKPLDKINPKPVPMSDTIQNLGATPSVTTKQIMDDSMKLLNRTINPIRYPSVSTTPSVYFPPSQQPAPQPPLNDGTIKQTPTPAPMPSQLGAFTPAGVRLPSTPQTQAPLNITNNLQEGFANRMSQPMEQQPPVQPPVQPNFGTSFGMTGGIGNFAQEQAQPTQQAQPSGSNPWMISGGGTYKNPLEAMVGGQNMTPAYQTNLQTNERMEIPRAVPSSMPVESKVYSGPNTVGSYPELETYSAALRPLSRMDSTSMIGSGGSNAGADVVGSEYETLPSVGGVSYMSDDILPPVTQSAPMGEGFVPDLGQRRQSYFSEELARNPRLMQDLWTRANREVGSNPLNQQKWIETAANRAMFSGRSLDSVINDTRYFPAISMQPTRSPMASDFSNVVSNVFTGGSNLTNLATDNASLDVARRRQQAGVTGQWLGAPGTTKEYFYRSNAGPYKTRAGLEASKYAQQLASGAAPQQVQEQAPVQNGFSATLPQVQVQQPGNMQVSEQPMGQPQMVQEAQPSMSKQEMESNGFLNALGEVGSSMAGGVAQGIQNAPTSPVVAAAEAGASVLKTILDPKARANSPLAKLFEKDQETGKTPVQSFGNTLQNLFGGDSASENPVVNLGSMSPNSAPKNYNTTFANKLVYSDATGPTGGQRDDSMPLYERLFGAI